MPALINSMAPFQLLPAFAENKLILLSSLFVHENYSH